MIDSPSSQGRTEGTRPSNAIGVSVAVILWAGIAILALTPFLIPWLAVAGTVCDTGVQSGVPNTSGSCPRTVIPARGPSSALVRVNVATPGPGWIEGGYFFMRATTPDHRVVLEQRLETAVGEVYLQPGTYELTVYGRSCGGNCGFLDPPSFECTYPITLDANDLVSIDYNWAACT